MLTAGGRAYGRSYRHDVEPNAVDVWRDERSLVQVRPLLPGALSL